MKPRRNEEAQAHIGLSSNTKKNLKVRAATWKTRRKWEHNIKTDLIYIEWEGMD
jgi:hypothetical protein